MPFESLPEDVILSILRFSDLQEIFAFSGTCKPFYLISLQRSLWIGALTRTRTLTPLFCRTHEDLTIHDVKHLRHIALRTLRRDRNWSLPIPQVIGTVNSISLGNLKLDLICRIPGTALFLFHSQAEGQLMCWDVGMEKAVSAPLDIGRVGIDDISAGQEDPDRFCIALLVQSLVDDQNSNEFASLLVVEIFYGQEVVGVRLKSTFKHVFEPDSLGRWAVFMNEDIVGLLQANFADNVSKLEIVAFNRSSRKMAHITTDVSISDVLERGHSGTTTFNDDLFILIEDGSMSYQYRCPWLYFPYDWNLDCRSESILGLSSISPTSWLPSSGQQDEHVRSQVGALSANSSYGVLAASIHRITITHHDEPPQADSVVILKLHVIFWTRPDVIDFVDPVLVPKGQISIPGFLQRPHSTQWHLVYLAHSGRCILLIVGTSEGPPTLQFIRYDPQWESSSVHFLKLPFVVDLGRVRALSVDDHTGSVSFIDGENVLHLVPYA